MKTAFFLLLLTSASLVGCKGPRTTGNTPEVTRRPAGKVNVPEPVGAIVHHGACYGRCPVYTIQIWNSGKVRYSGLGNTAVTGVYEKNVGAEKTQRILQTMRQYRIDTMQAAYRVLVTDLASTNLTIEYPGRTQEIKNAQMGPEILYHISSSIDSLASKVDFSWTRISDTVPKQP